MTIEQKAKAYDEAIKVARSKIKNNKDHVLYEEDITDIFPELKDGNDELKWLTRFIEEEAYCLSMDIRDDEDRIKLKNLQKSLAWLKKQGESSVKFTKDDAQAKKEYESLKKQEGIRIDRAAEEYAVKGGLQPEAFLVIPAFKAGADWMARNSTSPSIKVYNTEVDYLSEIIEDASRGIYLDNQLINYLCSLKSRISHALE